MTLKYPAIIFFFFVQDITVKKREGNNYSEAKQAALILLILKIAQRGLIVHNQLNLFCVKETDHN